MRTTQRLVIATAAGPSILVILLMAIAQIDCRRPVQPPVTPDASDAARPAPVVNPEPGPVPPGNRANCNRACEHVEYVCPGSRAACDRTCARAGGADPGLIPCLNSAAGCPMLKRCDPGARSQAVGRLDFSLGEGDTGVTWTQPIFDALGAPIDPTGGSVLAHYRIQDASAAAIETAGSVVTVLAGAPAQIRLTFASTPPAGVYWITWTVTLASGEVVTWPAIAGRHHQTFEVVAKP
jgi:hypothetical protein